MVQVAIMKLNMNHNFVFTISLKKKILIAILVVFCKKKVKIIQYLLRIIANFLFVFFSSYQVKKKKRRQGISEEIDGD